LILLQYLENINVEMRGLLERGKDKRYPQPQYEDTLTSVVM